MSLSLINKALASHTPIHIGTGSSSGFSFSISNPLNAPTFEALVHNIIKFLVVVSVPILSLVILYVAFQMLTSGGDPEKFTTGKRTVLYGIIGFIIILLAQGVSSIIQNITGIRVTP